MSLKRLNFPTIFIKLVMNYVKGASSCINTKYDPSPTFNLNKGVRQGDPLSPRLYIICLDPLYAATNGVSPFSILL